MGAMTARTASLMKPRVYVRNPLAEKYVAQLKDVAAEVIVEPWEPRNPEPEPVADISSIDVVVTIGMRDRLHILNHAPGIKWVHSMSVGLDAMLTEAVIDSPVIITNARGCASIPIAEHTVTCIASMARGFPAVTRNQLQKKWVLLPAPIRELLDSTVGIVGYGEIGSQIAKRCQALGMNVIGCRRNPGRSVMDSVEGVQVVGLDQVDHVLAVSDFLVLAMPASSETHRFLNRQSLSRLKPGSYVINVGRGSAIDEADLLEALRSGHVAGAALDVFEQEPLDPDHPFWSMENVIVTPHHAYFSPRTTERNMELLLDNLNRYARGAALRNVVDKRRGY